MDTTHDDVAGKDILLSMFTRQGAYNQAGNMGGAPYFSLE
jgi:hypothetical protein